MVGGALRSFLAAEEAAPRVSYQVLARKWRPLTFDEVTGQAHVTTPLRNALLQEEVRPKDRPLDGLVRVDLEIRRKLEQGRMP